MGKMGGLKEKMFSVEIKREGGGGGIERINWN